MKNTEEKLEPTLLNETEAARFLNISRQTLIRLRQAGQVGYYRIARRVLYGQEHLEEFLASANQEGLALTSASEGKRS
jgi:excisionase family DNA binding protein